MTTTPDLRVGVGGAGQMGADHIQRITRVISGATVSAIVEPDAGRAAAAAAAPGSRAFASLDDALDASALEAVVIATPGQFHELVLVPALAAGLPVLCEKPLTPDSAEALRVLELEQTLDRPHIQLGFMRRFDDEYRALRELVVSGDAGELLFLRGVHRNPSVPESYTQSMLITDSVVHEFDVMPWLAGSPVASVEVKYPRRNDRAPERLREPILVLIELRNGVLVDVEMNVSVRFGYQVATEAVFQTGTARIGQPAGLQRWSDARFSIAEHTSFTTRFARAYDAQVQAWVDAVRDGSLVAGPNAWDGYLVALACEAGVRALSEPGPIAFAPAERPAFYA
ncbi:inositol 2-dehydrogenase [Leifsonia xyli subsp. xyli]|uniref:Inositol 2-dehydrogenase n=2 Tax=Leifsonia xyli subsp. xyli TaxID=59736 RepID=IOLG_LEIXX|nr:Gfo/Idh/MocA family oxidoreductase [Leifsonia xyli]Q6AC27.1 RecName: Full=Inositol 2-dehydrogenase; AltName: Full=Myo-inositol 2-dehydrogenase; Short=MI 2-dehydrogenase [Leifsonia xyli subsp. xyli str. CTCB07]AAT90065.1 myo-inositol dehydrogenase [Leifsonia xyli subsp. xyli str. CTCB07]ODA89949.1 inositol 2-dehydrogenase [Leifsonia xyli subsp. xyli]